MVAEQRENLIEVWVQRIRESEWTFEGKVLMVRVGGEGGRESCSERATAAPVDVFEPGRRRRLHPVVTSKRSNTAVLRIAQGRGNQENSRRDSGTCRLDFWERIKPISWPWMQPAEPGGWRGAALHAFLWMWQAARENGTRPCEAAATTTSKSTAIA